MGVLKKNLMTTGLPSCHIKDSPQSPSNEDGGDAWEPLIVHHCSTILERMYFQ